MVHISHCNIVYILVLISANFISHFICSAPILRLRKSRQTTRCEQDRDLPLFKKVSETDVSFDQGGRSVKLACYAEKIEVFFTENGWLSLLEVVCVSPFV